MISQFDPIKCSTSFPHFRLEGSFYLFLHPVQCHPLKIIFGKDNTTATDKGKRQL